MTKQTSEVRIASFHLSQHGLVPLGTPSFSQWVACGKFILQAEQSVQFWIGDWLLYGEKHFKKTDYERAMQETGLDYQTLANYKWVAASMPLSLRREKLSFHHHKEVVSLPQQAQAHLLDSAEKENWPVYKLKQEKYRLSLEAARPASPSRPTTRLLSGSVVTHLSTLPHESCDLIISSPPRASLTNDVVSLMAKILKINSHLYLFLQPHEYEAAVSLVQKYFTVKNILVYETASGSDFPSGFAGAYGFILFAHKGRRHLQGPSAPSVLTQFSSLQLGTHPTEKPLPLLSYLIEKSTLQGEVILDPFCGTGFVGLAANNMGRDFIGIEENETLFHQARVNIGLQSL